jgi:MFS family permease
LNPPIHRDPQIVRLLAVGLFDALVRWFEILAFGILTWQQTGSAFWVASMTMLRILPMALFGVPFGALAARIPRRMGLLVTQGVLGATAVALMALAITGALDVWHLAVASFINGTAWAGDNPLRRGLIGDLAGAARMPRAMAFEALANAACRLAGPALGGLLLAWGGTPAVFMAAAVLYLLAFVALLPLAEPPPRPAATTAGIGEVLTGGFRAVREAPRLAATLWITLVFNIFAWPVLSMIPVIGQQRLALGSEGVGLLASMDGVGSLAGAAVLMLATRRAWHGRLYAGGVCVYLAGLAAFSLSPSPLPAGAALLVVGLGHSGFSTMQATLAYTSAPPERRLQAMGMLTMCIGAGPIGFLSIGWLAARIGAPGAALASSLAGLFCLAASWRLWRALLREPAQD